MTNSPVNSSQKRPQRSFLRIAAMLSLGGSALLFADHGLRAAEPSTVSPARPEPAQDFQRCAACHTATGDGVPNAFPALKGNVLALARTAAGRRYLVGALSYGLSGPVQSNGARYAGVMPAQAWLSDARMAAVLNHVITNIAKGHAKAFTEAEVSRLRIAMRGSTSAQIAASRPAR